MEPIKVALQGFDERSASRIKTTFLVNYRGKCVVSDDTQASVILIDLEGIGPDLDALLPTLNPANTIMLSSDNNAPPGFKVLDKPVKLDLLMEAITGSFSTSSPTHGIPSEAVTAQLLQQKLAPTHNDAASFSPRKLGTDSTYNPDDYFVSKITAALSSCPPGHVLQLITWDHKRMVFDSANNRLYSEIGKNEIRNLTAIPLAANLANTIRVEILETLPAAELLEGLHPLDLERTLWEMSYTTSRGRLPLGTDPAEKYYLAHWPNFTRLPAMKNGMRIAAIWAGSPQRLDDIATRLGIANEEVYAFYAGAAALGLTGIARRQSDHLLEKTVTRSAHPAKGLLVTLLGHLGSILKPQNSLPQHYRWQHEERA